MPLNRRLGDSDFLKHFAHLGHELGHVLGVDVADAADAEALRVGHFAGVDDVSTRLECIVKFLEFKPVGFRVVDRRDDGRLDFVANERTKTKRAHSLHHRFLIGNIACVARLHPALGLEFVQRACKRVHNVRR